VQQIAAVVFDWGGVLIDNPAAGLMEYCARALGVSVDQYTRAHDRYGEAFQKGLIPEEAFWQRVCGDLDRPPPKPSFWAQAFRAVYSPRDEVFALAGQVRQNGYRTVLLSNTEAPAMEFFLGLRYPMFDAAVFSCTEGVCKPQKEVYEIAARKLGTAPGQCVFVDDKPTFVDGARGAGMSGIVYESLGQVKRDLAALGVRM
jgi:putative hydrolase of the HAD superfamily